MTASANLAAVKATYDCYARGDVAGASAIFAPNVEVHGLEASGEFGHVCWTPRGGFQGFVDQIVKDWRREAYEPLRVDAEGEWVTGFVRVALTHLGTNKRFEGVMVHVFRFADGKCVEFHEFVDRGRAKAVSR